MASPYLSAHARIVLDGLAEGEAEVGEPVLDTGRHFRKVAADDDAIAFQSAQRPGEHWAVTPVQHSPTVQNVTSSETDPTRGEDDGAAGWKSGMVGGEDGGHGNGDSSGQGDLRDRRWLVPGPLAFQLRPVLRPEADGRGGAAGVQRRPAAAGCGVADASPCRHRELHLCRGGAVRP